MSKNMRKNKVKEIWSQGNHTVNGWLSIPATYSAEGIAHQGFDSVTVDLQHGMTDVQTAIGMLQAISATEAMPFVRVGGNDPIAIMKMLDAGAYGVICPMISTHEDAKRFADACRYPPRGHRSFGPSRGLLYGGADYFKYANTEILAIAMIETVAGVENIDAIVGVEGIDAIYIGPNDLSLDYGEPPVAEPENTRAAAAMMHLVARAHAHGKKAGVFSSNGAAAAHRRAQGFDMLTPGSDFNVLMSAIRQEVLATRG
jgi:4-hydroxy-2-oxoheptanedioate aldolase